MNKVRGAAFAAMLLGGVAAGQAQAANLVTNGDFETVDLSNPLHRPVGWTVDLDQALIDARGSDLVACCGVTGTPAELANHMIVFDGADPGETRISQDLHTIAGAAYDLVYFLGALGEGETTVLARLYDDAPGGGEIIGRSVLVPVISSEYAAQFAIDVPFVAVSDLTRLSFSYTGTGRFIDPVLDNVTVTGPAGVPEPASWALMLVGFGGLGVLLRRRRAEAVAA
ncbi:MAG TPA: PEPxxWA-CTERM sorting domain-containing protein [Phenylobacterium sp.]|nr:PEPxxWA-CTERM sorting domain-containing protein [Phenylobacterium sp.]